MKEKSKQLKKIEQAIAKGHKIGLCDGEGNSVTLPDGRIVAKCRVMHPTRRIRYIDGELKEYKDGQWCRCES